MSLCLPPLLALMLLQVAPGGSSVERESEPGNCIADSAMLIQLQSDFDELRWKHAQMEANLRQACVSLHPSLPPPFLPSLPRFLHPPNPLHMSSVGTCACRSRISIGTWPGHLVCTPIKPRMYWNQAVDQTCPPPLFQYYLTKWSMPDLMQFKTKSVSP